MPDLRPRRIALALARAGAKPARAPHCADLFPNLRGHLAREAPND